MSQGMCYNRKKVYRCIDEQMACADPEVGAEGTDFEKITKPLMFLSNTGLDSPEKSHGYQGSI